MSSDMREMHVLMWAYAERMGAGSDDDTGRRPAGKGKSVSIDDL